jgi:hypothetical protein
MIVSRYKIRVGLGTMLLTVAHSIKGDYSSALWAICVDLPPIIVPLVKLESPALELAGQPQGLEVDTSESYVGETDCSPLSSSRNPSHFGAPALYAAILSLPHPSA